jgi:hypothetical protein
MKKTRLRPLLIASIALAASVALSDESPQGWFKAGSSPKDYETAVDRETVHEGKPSASLKSIVPSPAGFGTLMQTAQAGQYRGKRVRMSGYVRAKDVTQWAGLWFRVDGPKHEPLAFDNMQQRAVKGTSDWAKYEIVLDVPEAAKEIAFGLLLTGPGQVWMAGLKFEPVGTDVAVTGTKIGNETVHPAPTNLNFDK